MKALIVYYGNYPEDRGILQLAKSLEKIGHDIDIVSKGSDYVDDTTGIRVFKKAEANYLLRKSWLLFLIARIFTGKYDYVFCREIPLIAHLVLIKIVAEFKLVSDIRENLSGMYLSGHKINLLRAFIAKFIFPILTRLMLRFSHLVCFSSQELSDALVGQNAMVLEKCIVTPNYPTKEYYEKAKNCLRDDQTYKKTIFFSGHIKQNRGLNLLSAALDQLSDIELLKLRIMIVGDGDAREELEHSLKKFSSLEVIFTGMVKPESVVQLGRNADVGFMGYIKTANSELTLPGKLFEYFACGLHVISTPRRSLEKLDLPVNMISYFNTYLDLATYLRELLAKGHNTPRQDIIKYAKDNFSQSQNIQILKERL